MPRGGATRNKPTAEKALRGNPGKRPMNLYEPKPGELRSTEPPDWMDRTAKACWRKTAPELLNMGLLTEADVNTLALYCQAYSRYRSATATIAKLEAGIRDEDTSDDMSLKDLIALLSGVSVRLEKAEASLRLLSHDLGLNPAARTRLSVGKADKPVDEMEALLDRRRA